MKNIIEINDITALELDVYARTSEVQLLRYNEPNPGLFIALLAHQVPAGP